MKKQIQLGDKVTDIITKFTGIVKGYSEDMNRNIGFFVQPVMKKSDTDYPQSYTIDADSLKIIKKQVVKEPTEPEQATNIKLGDKVKHINGIKGYTIRRHVYWNRCVHFSVTFKDNNGIANMIESSVDELTLIKKSKTKSSKVSTGGPVLKTQSQF